MLKIGTMRTIICIFLYLRSNNFRWTDQLSIFVDDSSGMNMWGMEDFQFNLGSCERSAATFIQSKTAFIANIDGPLRAIRSWLGANSGAITQRQIKFYEQMEVKTTFLRVHSIPGVFDYINFEVFFFLKTKVLSPKNSFSGRNGLEILQL